MNVLIVRATLKEENLADAQAATEKVIKALERAHREDVRYTVLSAGATLVALLVLNPDGSHPLATMPEYGELVEDLKGWYAEPPTVERMTVLGSYQLF
jgi:hypothetical protein